MTAIFTLTFLLSTAACFGFYSEIVEDLYNIFYNFPVRLGDCEDRPVNDLAFILYTKHHPNKGIALTNSNLYEINPNYSCIFIIHGWLGEASELWIRVLKDKYLDKGPANIILMDWSSYSNLPYSASICAVPQVGRKVGNFLCTLRKTYGRIIDRIIGFSLGAHVAGFAGQQVQAECRNNITEIIALDAAGPGYLDVPANKRLDKTDASFVQAIHTNNYQFGYTYPYGTVDFQVNCATPFLCGAAQPCCPIAPGIPTENDVLNRLGPMYFCNHIRSVVYFTVSLKSSRFLGVPCNSKKFALGSCRERPTTVMGDNCPKTAHGELFLNPNGMPPYPRGHSGTGGVGGLGGLECFEIGFY